MRFVNKVLLDAIRKGARILVKNPPVWTKGGSTRKVNFYYWYYGTYAMFQMGGRHWKAWSWQLKETVLGMWRDDRVERHDDETLARRQRRPGRGHPRPQGQLEPDSLR